MKEAGNTSKKTRQPGEANMDDEERHRFLAYLMPQLEPLRQACERNFVTQAGLIALACSHLYSNSTPTVFGLTLPNQVLNIVFPLVLTYLVIRMGYLINAYIFIRTGITGALSGFARRPAQFQDENTERMLRANALVELFCLEYKSAWSKGVWRTGAFWASVALLFLPLILSAIFALNHILAALYVRRIAVDAPGPAKALGALLGLAMLSCYLHFMLKAQKAGAYVISIGTIVFSVVGYVLFQQITTGSFWGVVIWIVAFASRVRSLPC